MTHAGQDALNEGLAAGREESFAALYDRYAPELLRYAGALLRHRHDAEDAVQEIFVSLARSRQVLGAVTNWRAYLFTALRRAVSRQGSQQQAMVTLADAGDLGTTESTGVDLERAIQLERALRALPREQCELVALKVDGGLTFAEIAQVLGISANTAASRYRYALEKLRTALTGSFNA